MVCRFRSQRGADGRPRQKSVLHAARLQELGSGCRVTSYALLKSMGKTDTGSNRATLQNRIERLRANAVTIKQGRYSYIGGLIAGAVKDEITQEWVIELDTKLRPLFEKDQFTQIEWAVRHALTGQPLAQWLHGFNASHAKPFPLRVQTLHKLCGSEANLMSDFAKTLRKALDAVVKVSTAHGQGFSYSIRGDLVYIQKMASGPQLRYLAKKVRTHPVAKDDGHGRTNECRRVGNREVPIRKAWIQGLSRQV